MSDESFKFPMPPESNEAKGLKDAYEVFYQPLTFFALLIASWFTTYSGVLAMAEWNSGASEQTQELAMLVSAAAMGALFALWHYAMRLIPRYASGLAKSIGVLVLLFLIVLLAMSSTYTSFIGLTRDSAYGLHLQAQTDSYAANTRLIAPRAAAMEDALFAIAPQAEAACERYRQELNSGILTGASGRGVVTGYLSGFCSGKTEIAEALQTTIEANTARLGEIEELSLQMDSVIFERNKSIGDRALDLLMLARRMDTLLQELENSDRTKGLRAASAAMSGSITDLDGASTTLGRAQQQAVRAILQEERASGAAIAGLIDEIEAMPVPEAGRAQLLPPQILVLRYWQYHLPQLALALAIDLFAPLSIVLFWAAAIKARARRRIQ